MDLAALTAWLSDVVVPLLALIAGTALQAQLAVLWTAIRATGSEAMQIASALWRHDVLVAMRWAHLRSLVVTTILLIVAWYLTGHMKDITGCATIERPSWVNWSLIPYAITVIFSIATLVNAMGVRPINVGDLTARIHRDAERLRELNRQLREEQLRRTATLAVGDPVDAIDVEIARLETEIARLGDAFGQWFRQEYGPSNRSVLVHPWRAFLLPLTATLTITGWMIGLATLNHASPAYIDGLLIIAVVLDFLAGSILYLLAEIAAFVAEVIRGVPAKIVNAVFRLVASAPPILTWENVPEVIGEITGESAEVPSKIMRGFLAALVVVLSVVHGLMLFTPHWGVLISGLLLFGASEVGLRMRERQGDDTKEDRKRGARRFASILVGLVTLKVALVYLSPLLGHPFHSAWSGLATAANAMLSFVDTRHVVVAWGTPDDWSRFGNLAWEWTKIVLFYVLVVVIAIGAMLGLGLMRKTGKDDGPRFVRWAAAGVLIFFAAAFLLPIVGRVTGMRVNPHRFARPTCPVVRDPGPIFTFETPDPDPVPPVVYVTPPPAPAPPVVYVQNTTTPPRTGRSHRGHVYNEPRYPILRSSVRCADVLREERPALRAAHACTD